MVTKDKKSCARKEIISHRFSSMESILDHHDCASENDCNDDSQIEARVIRVREIISVVCVGFFNNAALYCSLSFRAIAAARTNSNAVTDESV